MAFDCTSQEKAAHGHVVHAVQEVPFWAPFDAVFDTSCPGNERCAVIYVAVRCLFGFSAPDAVWRRPRRFARSYLGSAWGTSLQVSAEADEPNHGVSPSLVRMFNSALSFIASAWRREPCRPPLIPGYGFIPGLAMPKIPMTLMW